MQGNASLDLRTGMSGGAWATKRLATAMKAGRPMSPKELRTNDTLRKDEWKFIDSVLVEEGKIRLKGIADLIRKGLVKNIPNAMGKTMVEWEKVSDMEDAEMSLSGLSRTENDRVDFDLDGIPLPILHKDFNINLRTLAASRERGEPLDTMQARVSGRKVNELLEKLLFQGTSKKFGGRGIYGYTTHPNRNTASFGAGGAWSGSKTGEQMLIDVQTLITALHGDRFYGPYTIYLPATSSTIMSSDFKTNSDKTVRQRLMEVEEVEDIKIVDQLPTANLVAVQMTSDVVELLNGEPVQTIQWDEYGGMQIAFKVFGIMIPLIRADADGRSGVFHMA